MHKKKAHLLITRNYHYLLLTILVFISFFLRIFWLDVPHNALIFDEAYYVNAARIINGENVPKDSHYHGSIPYKDPNIEHPPLAKVYIALSIRTLGDNAYGWRIPSIIAGMLCIVLIYAFVKNTADDKRLALLAATLFSFDNLVFIHSRIATLDIFMLLFLLCASLYFSYNLYTLSGAFCALASLTKINGSWAVFGFILLLIFLGWRHKKLKRLSTYKHIFLLLAGFFITFFLGLWLLDKAYTNFTSPIQHLQYIWQYSFSLTQPGGAVNNQSNPLQWLTNDVQIDYFRVDQYINSPGQTLIRPLIYFRGAMNPMIIGLAFLSFFYSIWKAWKVGDKLSTWVILWVISLYFPYFFLYGLDNRVSYIFYFLPTIPAIAVSISQFIVDMKLPKFVVAGFIISVLIGFINYWPFRNFW